MDNIVSNPKAPCYSARFWSQRLVRMAYNGGVQDRLAIGDRTGREAHQRDEEDGFCL